MWDPVQISEAPLSHDLPCTGCGHALHTFLACSDSCDCVRSVLPGQALAA